MEKHGVDSTHDSEMDCNTSASASREHHEVEGNYSKFISDGTRVFQHSEQCSVEASCSCDPITHNLQSDEPYNFRLKVSSAVRISEARAFNSEDYKQELREHQIHKWMLRHRYTQGKTPRSHWLGMYPQPRDGAGVSENAGVVGIEIGQHLWKNHIVQQGQHTHPLEEGHVESSKKQVHFVSKNTIMEPSEIQRDERLLSRKRKLQFLERDFTAEDSARADILNNKTVLKDQLVAKDCTNTADITLREWLSRPGRTVDPHESLNIFKQILQFVELAHVQGVVLKNIRPSSFILSSLHRVSFMDSASSSSSSGSSEPSRGTPYIHTSILSDIARSRSQNPSDSIGRGFSAVQFVNSKALDLPRRLSANSEERFVLNYQDSKDLAEYKTLALPAITAVSTDRVLQDKESDFASKSSNHRLGFLNNESEQNDCFPLRPMRRMEDAWYTSPEEDQDGTCSYACDIYSLGVLFFELFCPFSSLEEYSRAMLDLRHRILPPHLLSDRPKEAAFCLWLLHPDPNSRPKSRDILSSEIINDASTALAERQEAMNAEEKEAETKLLLDFLLRMQQQKQILVSKLEEEISCLTSDIMEVKRRQSHLHKSGMPFVDQNTLTKLPQDKIYTEGQWKSKKLPSEMYKNEGDVAADGDVDVESLEVQKFGVSDNIQRQEQICAKSARLMSNFDKFEKAYFAMRSKVQNEVSGCHSTQEVGSTSGSECSDLRENKMAETSAGNHQGKDLLGCFFDGLCKYARYSRFEVKATLLHGNLLNSSNMVCSLSFDRDQEYFATAGICKRIRIFDCDAVLNEDVDIHYPVVEMMANSKLSSICWNSYIKSHIASSDYNGVVQLWDASMAQPLMQYKEHKKRTWSVDFSHADPTKLASGSDDRSVKLWSINQEGSIGTIKTEANVCCVQFPGDSAHLLAFGSADYKIYCYDLRNTRQPWCILADHSRTVSYVKFIDSNTLISASTDNTLKLWDISRTNFSNGICRTPTLTYTGHTNEKNFVGLSVMDGYIACGSETNEVFAYHKLLPMPIGSHKFGWIDPLSGKVTPEDTGKFVSSVCWRAKSKTLVAANSMGNIKVLEMV